MSERVTGQEFIVAVSGREDVQSDKQFSAKDIEIIYKRMIQEFFDVVSRGARLTLSGVGSFYMQKHKGHPVQFGEMTEIDDYYTLKFSASQAANRDIRRRMLRERL